MSLRKIWWKSVQKWPSYEGQSKSFAIRYNAQMTQANFLLLFNTNALNSNAFATSVKKALWCQSNRILVACCPDTTQWSVWSHYHRKSLFHKVASSDDEIGISHWVPALLSRVDVRAVRIQCPFLQPAQLEPCAPVRCHAEAADLLVSIPCRLSLIAWSRFLSTSP